jgi:response regulator NasT
MAKKNVTLLIAEDDLMVSLLLQTELEKLGYTVVGQAANGEQAVRMARTLPVDVILMDIGMPKMDGLEATRLIRQHCATPVIILSANPATEFSEKARAAGAGAYLRKPVALKEIERAITEALTGSGEEES